MHKQKGTIQLFATECHKNDTLLQQVAAYAPLSKLTRPY